jgi:signal transduction histidine kinase
LTGCVHELDSHIDRLAHEIAPAAIDELGLIAAMATHVELFTERFGIPTDFHHRGFTDVRVPAVVEITLYRVAQEALTNVVKHASATGVSVILEKRDAHVQLIVEDDGVGFDPEAVLARQQKGTLGLIGMRERVAVAGGTLNIESRMGGGTSIFVRLTV